MGRLDNIVTLAVGGVGILLITVGAALVYVPAGLVVLGAGLLAAFVWGTRS